MDYYCVFDIHYITLLSKLLKLLYQLVFRSNSCLIGWITQSLCFFFSQEELDLIDRDDEQKFLASADYLASNGMPSLISNMQSAVKEVLKGYVHYMTNLPSKIFPLFLILKY